MNFITLYARVTGLSLTNEERRALRQKHRVEVILFFGCQSYWARGLDGHVVTAIHRSSNIEEDTKLLECVLNRKPPSSSCVYVMEILRLSQTELFQLDGYAAERSFHRWSWKCQSAATSEAILIWRSCSDETDGSRLATTKLTISLT